MGNKIGSPIRKSFDELTTGLLVLCGHDFSFIPLVPSTNVQELSTHTKQNNEGLEEVRIFFEKYPEVGL